MYSGKKIAQEPKAALLCANCQRWTYEMHNGFTCTDVKPMHTELKCNDCGYVSKFLDIGIIMVFEDSEPQPALERGAIQRRDWKDKP